MENIIDELNNIISEPLRIKQEQEAEQLRISLIDIKEMFRQRARQGFNFIEFGMSELSENLINALKDEGFIAKEEMSMRSIGNFLTWYEYRHYKIEFPIKVNNEPATEHI